MLCDVCVVTDFIDHLPQAHAGVRVVGKHARREAEMSKATKAVQTLLLLLLFLLMGKQARLRHL